MIHCVQVTKRFNCAVPLGSLTKMTESGVQDLKPSNIGRGSSKVILVGLAAVVFATVGVWAFNYLSVDRPLQNALHADARDQVVSARAHYDNWVDPNTLVFDLTSVSGSATRMDVFRTFLQFASVMKDRRFGIVILAAHGKKRFTLDGSYFRQLGQEYGDQNPIYTIRTFPIHVSDMDGTKPFSEYTGGILGVLGKEMDQFSEFSDRWYLNDSRPSSAESAPTDPCATVIESDPHCGWKPHWENSGVSVNAIDGATTEFLSLESTDADRYDYGKLDYARLRICFENGKLCGGNNVSVGVKVGGMVAPMNYERSKDTSVRLRFDDEKPVNQVWGISDSNDALFPFGHEK